MSVLMLVSGKEWNHRSYNMPNPLLKVVPPAMAARVDLHYMIIVGAGVSVSGIRSCGVWVSGV